MAQYRTLYLSQNTIDWLREMWLEEGKPAERFDKWVEDCVEVVHPIP